MSIEKDVVVETTEEAEEFLGVRVLTPLEEDRIAGAQHVHHHADEDIAPN